MVVGSRGAAPLFGGLQLAVSVLLGAYVGYRVDAHWPTDPWGLVLGSVVGIAVGLYGFLSPFFRQR